MKTTSYIYRVTIAVPEAYIPDANQLALCLGEASADDRTFVSPKWQDALGNLYALASTVAKSVFVTGAQSPLVAPEFAPDVDLTAATRAQALLSIGAVAAPDRIATIVGGRLESAQDHISALGLEPIPVPSD